MFQLGLQNPVEITKWRENNYLASLTWFERHNLIGWFFVKSFSLADTKYWVIGFNHGVLCLAENPARGTGFWIQNTEGVAWGVLRETARPYYSMPLHCNTTIIVFKLLAIVEWKRHRADISSRHRCEAKQAVAKGWLPSNIHHWKAFRSFSGMT